MRSISRVLAGMALMAGGLAGTAPAMASGSSPHTHQTSTAKPANPDLSNQEIFDRATGDEQGYHNTYVWDGSATLHNMSNEGTVSSGGEWPFTAGSGMNATYAGDNVWVIFYSGASTATCWQMNGNNVIYATNGVCNTAHLYSLWVQTKAPNGSSGIGFVNVGASDAAGAGRYLYSSQNADDHTSGYCTCSDETYNLDSS